MACIAGPESRLLSTRRAEREREWRAAALPAIAPHSLEAFVVDMAMLAPPLAISPRTRHRNQHARSTRSIHEIVGAVALEEPRLDAGTLAIVANDDPSAGAGLAHVLPC